MGLRAIESSLSQIVVTLHDLARASGDPGIAGNLQRIAHDVSQLVERLRRLMIGMP